MSNDANLVRGPSFPDAEPRRTPDGTDADREATARPGPVAGGVSGTVPIGDPVLRERLLALAAMVVLTVLLGVLAVLAKLVDMPGLAHALMYFATAACGFGFVVMLVSLARGWLVSARSRPSMVVATVVAGAGQQAEDLVGEQAGGDADAERDRDEQT